ncbi:uncharacterized protein LOC114950188 isoform X3 [Acropora millepora]|uniref:uncharacterized protein LOC114950188 isoform X3 n=1 Tax=Acropora millepora TaxID=45264 RepID=UPI001CF580E8|nr:uncharacterized protein LOC114950188 isoform X3 [Acropora millepora]
MLVLPASGLEMRCLHYLRTRQCKRMMKLQLLSPAQRASVFPRRKLQGFKDHKLLLRFLVDLIPRRQLENSLVDETNHTASVFTKLVNESCALHIAMVFMA